mgnify:CR=1 FL=1
MTDSLRDRIAAAVDVFYIYDPCWHPDDWTLAVAGAVIEALGADCIYRYACHRCGGVGVACRHAGRDPRVISITDTAKLLGISTKTVRRCIADGRLKAVRIGPRLIRVDPESIQALMQPIGK